MTPPARDLTDFSGTLACGQSGDPGGDALRRLHLDRAFGLADQIVRSHQPHIHALAQELTKRGLVDGGEVEAIFRRVQEAEANR